MTVDQKLKLQALGRAIEDYQDWKLRHNFVDSDLADAVVVASKELMQSVQTTEIGDQMEQVSAVLKQFNAELRRMNSRVTNIESELGLNK